MKCLSLIQPYAELVVRGSKKTELRKWNTRFRGQFMVHASKRTDLKACRRFKINPERLVNGAIIGSANIYGVKYYSSRKEFVLDSKKHLANYGEYGSSRYGFMLKDAKRLNKPVYMKGMLNFFELGRKR
jgi:hypothetical protein